MNTEHWWHDTQQGNTEILRENPQHDPHGLAWNHLYGDRLVTNYLSHGTVFKKGNVPA
jgi:hypothetical protein